MRLSASEEFLYLSSTGWAAVAALASILTLVVAFWAARLALSQLKQGRELAEEQARPYVVAYLAENEAVWWYPDFVLKNVGQTAARDLRVSFSRPWSPPGDATGHEFMETRFIAEGTPFLAPGQALSTSFGSGREILTLEQTDPEAVKPITVTLGYRDRMGKEIVDAYEIDPLILKGAIRLEVHGLHHIAQTLRAWAKKQGIHSF